MKAVAVIPARYESSRFPGKPLADILEKPMIQRVYEQVAQSETINDIFVATDDKRIFDCVKEFGGRAIMTGNCQSGTDRVYQSIKGSHYDIVINVQGDEPLIRPTDIDSLTNALLDDNSTEMVTLITKISDNTDIDDPNNVKVVTDISGNALYFSRSRIPYNGRNQSFNNYYKHIGIYGYTTKFLQKFVTLGESPNEKIEKLEQLRALDNGYKIRTIVTDYNGVGVDTPDDIKKVVHILMESGQY